MFNLACGFVAGAITFHLFPVTTVYLAGGVSIIYSLRQLLPSNEKPKTKPVHWRDD